MARCGVKHIEDHTFKGMATLQELDLSHNKLTTFGPNSLRGAVDLHTLQLQGNEISVIHEEAFARFPHLLEINLNGNKLVTVPVILFSGLHLEKLYMGSNPMEQTEPFDIPKEIVHLKLVPYEIVLESYRQYPELTHLKLGQCRTTDVYWPDRPMPNIHVLELTPTGGFLDGNVILESLELFPRLSHVKLHIVGFVHYVTEKPLNSKIPYLHHLDINGKEVSVLSLHKNAYLKSLIKFAYIVHAE